MTGASPPASLRLGSRDIPYGWVIVAALSVTETVTWGVVYYGFPVFLRPMDTGPGRLTSGGDRCFFGRSSGFPRSRRCRSGAGSTDMGLAG